MITMDLLEVIEMRYHYIRVKTKNPVNKGLSYTVPLNVPMVEGLKPFKFEVTGVATAVSYDGEVCTFTLKNLQFERLEAGVDASEIYEEIVDWWIREKEREDNFERIQKGVDEINKHIGEIVAGTIHLTEKMQKIKRKLDIIKLIKMKPINKYKH